MERRVALAALVALGVAFLVLGFPRYTAAFGDSDEGINAANWGLCSRSLRELGPAESAMGGRRVDGARYATHPPMLCWSAAAVEEAGGERPWATRLPSVLASLASIPLLFLVLEAVGARPAVAAAAAVVALGTPMFLLYGPMVDTPMVALPFGLLAALLWHRRAGGRWLLVAGLLAGLAGWQAALLCGLAGVAAFVGGGLRRSAGLVAGAVIGAGLSVAWSVWVYGSLDGLLDKAELRADAGGQSFAEDLEFQLRWLAELLGPALAGLLAAGVAVARDRRWRPLAGVSLLTVVLYGLVFRAGAGSHQYWNYWAVLPVAVGVAWVLGRADDRLRADGIPGRGRAALLGVVVVLAVAGALVPSNRAADAIERGHRVGDLLADARFPAGQTSVPYLGEPERLYSLVVHEAGLRAEPVGSGDELRRLAGDRPGDLVLVPERCLGEPVCERLRAAHGGRAALVPAADAASAARP